MYKSITQNGLFQYAITPQTIATTAGVTPNITLSSDSDFVCTHIYGNIISAAAMPDASVLLTMQFASGELFQNVAIDMLSFSKIVCPVAAEQGIAGNPIVLLTPMRIPANSQINFNIVNNTLNTIIVQVTMVGYKVPAI